MIKRRDTEKPVDRIVQIIKSNSLARIVFCGLEKLQVISGARISSEPGREG